MAVEDFTTWTEVDPNGVLTVTSTTVTGTNQTTINQGTCVYVNKGSGYWDGDFRFRVGPINVSSSTDLGRVLLFSVGIGTASSSAVRPGVLIHWYRQNFSGTSRLYLDWHQTGDTTVYFPTASDYYDGAAVLIGEDFWVELERSGTTVTAKIYSDAYTTLVDTLSVTVTVESYSHAYVAASYNNGSGTQNSYTIQGVDLEPSGGGSAPTITDAGDETYTNGETGIVITGTSFGASQGSGTVKISPTDDVDDANAVAQTVTAWGDTSVTFTAVRSTLAVNTTCYLFVTKDGGYSNASGFPVSFYTVGDTYRSFGPQGAQRVLLTL